VIIFTYAGFRHEIKNSVFPGPNCAVKPLLMAI